MRYLGIDYGFKRVGLSLCDASESIVSPLCQLDVKDAHPSGRRNNVKTEPGYQEGLFEQLKEIITQHQVEALVVGLPLNMNGSESSQAEKTRQFSQQLARAMSLPVYLQDERLSTAAADEILAESGLTKKKRKARRDMLAACDILQEFILKPGEKTCL